MLKFNFLFIVFIAALTGCGEEQTNARKGGPGGEGRGESSARSSHDSAFFNNAPEVSDFTGTEGTGLEIKFVTQIESVSCRVAGQKAIVNSNILKISEVNSPKSVKIDAKNKYLANLVEDLKDAISDDYAVSPPTRQELARHFGKGLGEYLFKGECASLLFSQSDGGKLLPFYAYVDVSYRLCPTNRTNRCYSGSLTNRSFRVPVESQRMNRVALIYIKYLQNLYSNKPALFSKDVITHLRNFIAEGKSKKSQLEKTRRKFSDR